MICSACCRNSRPDSSGLPQLLTHQAHQDGQILHVTVSHHGRTYVGALVLESKWSVSLPNLQITRMEVQEVARLSWHSTALSLCCKAENFICDRRPLVCAVFIGSP